MRPIHKNTVVISLCGIALLVMAVSVTAFQMLQANATSDGLINVRITADGPLTVEAGGSIRLTAEGDYGTTTMPVRADWFFRKGVPAILEGCEKAKTCTFIAGEDPGNVAIEAEAEGYRAGVTVEITEALENPFTDALPDWAAPSIIHLYRAGIVKGYDNGRYGSADPVTRGQVVTLLYRMLRSADLIAVGKTGCDAYSDVRPGDYMEEAVCAFAAEGWGFDASKLLPNDAASRGIVAKLVGMVGESLLKEAGLDAESLADGPQMFDDVAPGDTFFVDVSIANALGVMTGYPTGDFGVRDSINRASMAVILDRFLAQFHSAGLGQSPMQGATPTQPVVATASSSKDSKTARSGMFNLSDWVNYYDFSKEAAVPFPYDPPYDIRIAKPGPLADQTKVWVYKGDGWISRIDPALQRSYPNVRKEDCIRQLKETRRFDDPKIGAGDTVCIDTEDGYIVKMTLHGDSMEYQRWPGDIDYPGTPTTAVSPTLGGASSAAQASSVSSFRASSSAPASAASSASSSSSSEDGFPPLPAEPFGGILASGTIALSYQSWTTFDVDAGKQNAPVGEYDMSFPHRNTPFEVDVDPSRTKIMLSPTPYEETTETDCLAALRQAQGYSAVVPAYNESVCFQTLSGLVGKVSSGWPSGSVRYETWGWTFLPEYQPGTTIY